MVESDFKTVALIESDDADGRIVYPVHVSIPKGLDLKAKLAEHHALYVKERDKRLAGFSSVEIADFPTWLVETTGEAKDKNDDIEEFEY